MMIVMQTVLQLAHERETRRRRMEGKAVHRIFAQVKQDRAERDLRPPKRDRAESPSDEKPRDDERQYRRCAVTKETAPHISSSRTILPRAHRARHPAAVVARR